MKQLFFLITTISALAFFSCKNSTTENETSEGTKQIEFSINGNAFTMLVPDTAKGTLEIKEQSWGATEVVIGSGFQISITEGEGDITLMKSDIAGNDVNKFKRFINDEPNLLLWESEIVKPEFHFYTVQKIEKSSFIIEDMKAEVFTEQDVKAMLNAAKSLKVKSQNVK
jgi:hypothetical protein